MIDYIQEGLQTCHEGVLTARVSNILHHLSENLRLLSQNGVDSRQHVLHEISVVVHVVDDIDQGLHIEF